MGGFEFEDNELHYDSGHEFRTFPHPVHGYKLVLDGCLKDEPDPNDIHYTHHQHVNPEHLPGTVDLREHLTRVEDQGQLGSCTANAIAAAVEYLEKRVAGQSRHVSRLFVYYMERVLTNTVHNDSGGRLRDGMKVINKHGVCEEKLWPYIPSHWRSEPSEEAIQAAKQHIIDEYQRVPVNTHAMKACLAEGYPFVFSIKLYPTFELFHRGKIPLPHESDQSTGSHAMLCVGYSDADNCFMIRNSWGPSWGDGGYAYIPYEYLGSDRFTNDCWMVKRGHNLRFAQDIHKNHSLMEHLGGSHVTTAHPHSHSHPHTQAKSHAHIH